MYNIIKTIKQLKHSKTLKLDLIPSNSQLNSEIHELLKSNTFLFNNVYMEGYPYKRYYEGCEHIDIIETMGQNILTNIYGYKHVNIQPLSGAIANQIVYNALLENGDTILALDIYAGGHITHNAINIMSTRFKFINYKINNEFVIDYKQIETLTIKHKPKLIIAGYSVGTYDINHKKIREIANITNSLYMADLAHIIGLVAAKIMNNPYPHAHIVTCTTHKTMCGIKGAIIMCDNSLLSEKINKTLFPKTQGGANFAQIVINTVNFKHMLSEKFINHMKNVVFNANLLTECLNKYGVKTITKQTVNHMNVIDLYETNICANNCAKILNNIGIITNANASIKDKSFAKPTSIRFGTNIITERQITQEQINKVAFVISNVINDIKNNVISNNIEKYRLIILNITKKLKNIQ